MNTEQFFQELVDRGGSDLFITSDAYVFIKVAAQMVRLGSQVLTKDQLMSFTKKIMTEEQQRDFFTIREINFAVHIDKLGRFRANAFFHIDKIGFVFRRVSTEIPSYQDLNLPESILKFIEFKRGLILFVGATGSGKTNSLEALLSHRNNIGGHIITIEDPIEFLHKNQKGIVTQREVGTDTKSIELALENVLRQAPDVVMIGEVRTAKAMSQVIAMAETGHLALTTLHSNNSNQALDRILSFFDSGEHYQIQMGLALNLHAIISQRLIPLKAGGYHPVFEILINTPLMSDLILKWSTNEMKDLMKKSSQLGMQTFDQGLYDLYMKDMISKENALLYSDSKNDLKLMIKLKKRDH